MKSDKIILGIDPGTNIMGYGVIKSDKLKLKKSGMKIRKCIMKMKY